MRVTLASVLLLAAACVQISADSGANPYSQQQQQQQTAQPELENLYAQADQGQYAPLEQPLQQPAQQIALESPSEAPLLQELQLDQPAQQQVLDQPLQEQARYPAASYAQAVQAAADAYAKAQSAAADTYMQAHQAANNAQGGYAHQMAGPQKQQQQYLYSSSMEAPHTASLYYPGGEKQQQQQQQQQQDQGVYSSLTPATVAETQTSSYSVYTQPPLAEYLPSEYIAIGRKVPHQSLQIGAGIELEHGLQQQETTTSMECVTSSPVPVVTTTCITLSDGGTSSTVVTMSDTESPTLTVPPSTCTSTPSVSLDLRDVENVNVTAAFRLSPNQFEYGPASEFCASRTPGLYCYTPAACGDTCIAGSMISCPEGIVMRCLETHVCMTDPMGCPGSSASCVAMSEVFGTGTGSGTGGTKETAGSAGATGGVGQVGPYHIQQQQQAQQGHLIETRQQQSLAPQRCSGPLPKFMEQRLKQKCYEAQTTSRRRGRHSRHMQRGQQLHGQLYGQQYDVAQPSAFAAYAPLDQQQQQAGFVRTQPLNPLDTHIVYGGVYTQQNQQDQQKQQQDGDDGDDNDDDDESKKAQAGNAQDDDDNDNDDTTGDGQETETDDDGTQTDDEKAMGRRFVAGKNRSIIRKQQLMDCGVSEKHAFGHRQGLGHMGAQQYQELQQSQGPTQPQQRPQKGMLAEEDEESDESAEQFFPWRRRRFTTRRFRRSSSRRWRRRGRFF